MRGNCRNPVFPRIFRFEIQITSRSFGFSLGRFFVLWLLFPVSAPWSIVHSPGEFRSLCRGFVQLVYIIQSVAQLVLASQNLYLWFFLSILKKDSCVLAA